MSGSNSIRLQQMHTRLKALKIADLRVLLLQYGEKADKMKKADVINRIVELTEAGGVPIEKPEYWTKTNLSPTPAEMPALVKEEEAPKKKRGRPRKNPVPDAPTEQSSAATVRVQAEAAAPRGTSATVQRGRTALSRAPQEHRGAERMRSSHEERKAAAHGGAEAAWREEEGGRGGSWRAAAEEEPDWYAGASEGLSQDYTRGASAAGRQGRRGGQLGRRLRPSALALKEEELDALLLEREPEEEAGRSRSLSRGEGERDGSADMELCFLGTASCLPSLTRGVSSIALRVSAQQGSRTWIFDAGEGSQIQAQKSWMRPSSVERIFVTHLHGDHSFGIVGLMCLIGQNRDKLKQPLHLYGPAGLRSLLRVTLQLTGSRAIPPYRVVELHGIPYLHGRFIPEPESACMFHEPPRDRRFKEVDDGWDVWPDEHGEWTLVDEGGMEVKAAVMQHTMPCVGFAVKEARGQNRLRFDVVEEIVERNKEGLRKIYGRGYKRVYKDLKALQTGEHFVMPDGERVSAEGVQAAAKEGRKIVILGDTCDASAMLRLAQGADVVVHEATNAWIPQLDDKSEMEVEQDAIRHGHSTPHMAGAFARAANAKRLILTHFSPRYRGDDSAFSRMCMQRIESYAREAAQLSGDDVIAAYDLMTVPLERPGYIEG